MKLETSQTIRTWARRVPLLAVAASALLALVVLASGSFLGLSPLWLVAPMFTLLLLTINSEVGTLRAYADDGSLLPLLFGLLCVGILAPLVFTASLSVSLSEGQGALFVLATLGGMAVGIAINLFLQKLARPAYEAEGRAYLLKKLAVEEAAVLATEGALPKAFAQMVIDTRARAATIAVDELRQNVVRLQDYATMARLLKPDTH